MTFFFLVPAYWPPTFFNILQFIGGSIGFCVYYGIKTFVIFKITYLVTLLLNKIYEWAACIQSSQPEDEEYEEYTEDEDNGPYSTNYFTPRKKGLDYFIHRDAKNSIYNSKYIGEDKTD